MACAVPGRMTELGEMVQVEFGGPPPQPSDTLPLRPSSAVNARLTQRHDRGGGVARRASVGRTKMDSWAGG